MKPPRLTAGDAWGGVSAMLVALPSAIAFGVTIFAPLGPQYAARGAAAGMLGAMAIGLVASALGGTDRLISAPCAPAAAVLSGAALQLIAQGTPAESVVILLGVIALAAGVIQIIFGAVGLGRLIKYMPYPVVSGYLSGVGLLIIMQQVPKLLGAPKSMHLIEAMSTPSAWQWSAVAVGVVTIGAVLIAPRITKAIPATIAGLLAGSVAYAVAAVLDPSLRSLAANASVVGKLSAGSAGILAGFGARMSAARTITLGQLTGLAATALSLAVLLSIDTLKTCVVVDAKTRTRHNSNRELIGQGVANVASMFVGGIPGAGTMGATLVNLTGGATTRLSGVIEGFAALLAFIALGSVLAWTPIAALAGILIVVGARMFDTNSLHLLKSRATILDFVVIVAVVIVAESVSLIAASAVGVALAIMLFIREQVRTSVVRQQRLGSQIHSKQIRLPQEMEVLDREGQRTAVIELQGSLFFGTTDQLYTAIEPHLATRRFLILDMRRVRSVDVTAAHMLEQIADMMHERQGELLLADLSRNIAAGVDAARYLGDLGLYENHRARVFGELDEALEWIEEIVLDEAHVESTSRPALALGDIALFNHRQPDTLAALESCMERRTCEPGDRIFATGDTGDELFLIRRGAVRIALASDNGHPHHVATFRRGDFFGEMAFLDHQPRSADAVAERETELFVLARGRFDRVADEHRRLGQALLDGVATALANRLRRTNLELEAWQAG